jgi:hypothetical protein
MWRIRTQTCYAACLASLPIASSNNRDLHNRPCRDTLAHRAILEAAPGHFSTSSIFPLPEVVIGYLQLLPASFDFVLFSELFASLSINAHDLTSLIRYAVFLSHMIQYGRSCSLFLLCNQRNTVDNLLIREEALSPAQKARMSLYILAAQHNERTSSIGVPCDTHPA